MNQRIARINQSVAPSRHCASRARVARRPAATMRDARDALDRAPSSRARSTRSATPSASGASTSRDAPTPAATRALIARCSWCFHETSHAAVTRSSAARAPRACGACAGRTRACARFATCRAMARSGDGWDDDACLACANAVTKNNNGFKWSDAEGGDGVESVARRMSPSGRCSWCGEETRHRVTRATGRRGTYLSHCARCARATHKCERCAGGIREDRGREVREVRGMGGDVDDERGVRGGDETRRVVLVVRGKEFARQAWDARERRVRVHGVWGGDGGVRAVRRGRGGDAQALAAGWGDRARGAPRRRRRRAE